MAVREIALLGNPILYGRCTAVTPAELEAMKTVVTDLHDTLFAFKERHGFGRAIAAPQIGVTKRLIYVHIDAPIVLINPSMEIIGNETMVLWDDCMSFPDILIKVRRHKRIRLSFQDLDWKNRAIDAENGLAELLQHEYDHLDGILATDRALDGCSIALAHERKQLSA